MMIVFPSEYFLNLAHCHRPKIPFPSLSFILFIPPEFPTSPIAAQISFSLSARTMDVAFFARGIFQFSHRLLV